jgi:hypothetical protein
VSEENQFTPLWDGVNKLIFNRLEKEIDTLLLNWNNYFVGFLINSTFGWGKSYTTSSC